MNQHFCLTALLLLFAMPARSDADVVIAFDPTGSIDATIRQAANQKLNFFVSSDADDRVRGIDIGFRFRRQRTSAKAISARRRPMTAVSLPTPT
ncbi:hypothetical protein [Rubripirellula tenax]|nr:hypothetical protein [Rubripirellula tenax]